MSEYVSIMIDKKALLNLQESINIGKQIFQKKLTTYQAKIAKFEKINNMDTITFIKLFNNGKLGDDKEWLRWEHYASTVNLLEKKLSDLEGIRYES